MLSRTTQLRKHRRGQFGFGENERTLNCFGNELRNIMYIHVGRTRRSANYSDKEVCYMYLRYHR